MFFLAKDISKKTEKAASEPEDMKRALRFAAVFIHGHMINIIVGPDSTHRFLRVFDSKCALNYLKNTSITNKVVAVEV